MSGIFRNSYAYAANNNNNNNNNASHASASTTPNKRISYGAFCTSPGTLQDVTMDNSYAVGYRSPYVSLYQGAMSPSSTQGRSVREYEDQVAALKKENFNLKLRLFFIEESIPGFHSSGQDNNELLMKQIIDLKVELEILRKEVQEKQDLLKDAAQAMNQMEKIQQESELKNQSVIDDLKERISYLETQEAVPKHSDKKINDLLLEKDEVIREYEEKVKELAIFNNELIDDVEKKENENAEKEANIKKLQDELYGLRTQLADKICELQEAEEMLEKRDQNYHQACRTIQTFMQNIRSQQDEISELKAQRQNIVRATNNDATNKKNTVASSCVKVVDSSDVTHSLSNSEELSLTQKQHLEKTIENQRATIQKLEAEVKKKTASLQNLVNKELWEKNREIERLTKLINNVSSNSPRTPNSASPITDEFQKSLSEAEYARATERSKSSQRKADCRIHRLGDESDSQEVILMLRRQVDEARAETECAEKWRRECADVCAALATRLEELAGFLNSLLKHKDVLGVLAADRRRAMRKAVDRSLDLSKSLNMTLSVSGVSMTEHSLAQMCNLSEILCEVEGANSATFISHEEHAEQSIELLRAENNALKKELDKRRIADTKLNRRSLPLPIVEHQSESEEWSEPDRKVSLARMGLEDTSISISKDLQPQLADSESESDVLNQSRTSKGRNHDRIGQLEQMVSQRDERILEVQCLLVEADNRLKKESLRVLDLTQKVEELRQRNEELHTDLVIVGQQDDCNESILREQIREKSDTLMQLQTERDRIGVEAHISKMKINALKTEMKELKVQHEQELSMVALGEKTRIEQLHVAFDAKLEKRLVEKERLHKECLERDWIERSVYDECRQQLCQLQEAYIELQHNNDFLVENERTMKQSLIDSELAARSLKKQLDESTLQASKAVVERSKALSDKLQLEKRERELVQKLGGLEAERTMLECRIEEFQHCQQFKAVMRQNNSDVSQSGYTSEEVPAPGIKLDPARSDGESAQRVHNSSPDLGIESDAGRGSSTDMVQVHHELLATVELLTENNEDDKDGVNGEEEELEDKKATKLEAKHMQRIHDCDKVEQENAELRRKLIRTKRAFENTYKQLRISNERKAQIEKEIKGQILKTHNVLKSVRANMENEM